MDSTTGPQSSLSENIWITCSEHGAKLYTGLCNNEGTWLPSEQNTLVHRCRSNQQLVLTHAENQAILKQEQRIAYPGFCTLNYKLCLRVHPSVTFEEDIKSILGTELIPQILQSANHAKSSMSAVMQRAEAMSAYFPTRVHQIDPNSDNTTGIYKCDNADESSPSGRLSHLMQGLSPRKVQYISI